MIKVTWDTGMKLLNWIWRGNVMFEMNRWMQIHPTYSPTSSHVDLLSLHHLNKWKRDFLISIINTFQLKESIESIKNKNESYEARWWLQKFKAWSACIPRKLFFLTNNKKIDTTTWKLKLKAKKKKKSNGN